MNKLNFNKYHKNIVCFFLCLGLVFGSALPSFADSSTSQFQFYRAGSGLNPYTEYSGKNSADMIGRLLDVSSYNQSMIYNRLLQMSASGADLTTVNTYITSIDSTLDFINDTLGTGNSLNNILGNLNSVNQHLGQIFSSLSYWDNSHGRSYDLSEMIFNSMSYINQVVENTTSVPAIKQDTSYIPGIKTDTSSINTSLTSKSTIGTFLPNFSSIRTGIGVLGTRQSFTDPVINWRTDNGASYNFGSYNVSYITDYLRLLNFNLTNLAAMTFSPMTYYGNNRYVTFDGSTGASVALYSLGDMISLLNTNITTSLSRLGYVFADDNTINAKLANASQEQTVLSNFTGSGQASASVSDFGTVKDSIVEIKDGFSGGASASNAFGFMDGNSNAWDWFTQSVADSLDSTQGSNNSQLRSSGSVSYDTPLLDSYYNYIFSILLVNE